MNWQEVCHWLAQAAVNIAEGKHNAFEPNSKVHRALNAFCEYVTRGQVTFKPTRRKLDVKTLAKALRDSFEVDQWVAELI